MRLHLLALHLLALALLLPLLPLHALDVGDKAPALTGV